MTKVEREPSTFEMTITRVFFLVAMLDAAVYGWSAARAFSGIWFEIGAMWVLAAICGGVLWMGPRRGQMSQTVSNIVLLSVSVIMLSMGHVLRVLTHEAHSVSAMSAVLK